MKYFLLFSFFLIFQVRAAETGLSSCGSYAFKGTPKIIGSEMVLIINEGSRSEMVLTLARNEEAKIAPYMKIMTSGELHLGKLTGPRSGVIDGLKKLDYGTPDPVNTTLNSYLRPLKKEKCP